MQTKFFKLLSAFSIVMALDITNERIGISISTHPAESSTVHPLKPIKYMIEPKKQFEQDERVAKDLRNFIENHKVDTLVINWPVGEDGKFGKPCGKVLHFLDYCAAQKLISKRRPFALWEGKPVPKDAQPDQWGRSPKFAQVPDASMTHYSSRGRKYSSSADSLDASIVLKNFLDAHFHSDMDVEDYNVTKTSHTRKQDTDFVFDFDSYEGEGAYLQASLL